MSILDFAPANPSTTTRSGTNNTDRPQAKVWLNVGYDVNGTFISLPLGLPVDTMEPAKVTGQSEDWVKQQIARNQLLDAIQKAGAGLEPGAEQTIKLEIRIRRTKEKLDVSEVENEFVIDHTSIFG